MFVDELVCMLNLCPSLWVFGPVLVGVGGFFELTNDDSGDCLLVDRVLSGLFVECLRLMVEVSMESLILAQDERWRRA